MPDHRGREPVRLLRDGPVSTADGPSHRALHVTTETIPRTSIADLPSGMTVSCSPSIGWSLWWETETAGGALPDPKLVASEYDGPDLWLVLDVAGHVIVDSRPGR